MSHLLLLFVLIAVLSVLVSARPGENGGGVRKPPVTLQAKVEATPELSMDKKNAVRPGQGTHFGKPVMIDIF